MDQVSQVREKIDIVALISEYLPLKKAGRNFKVNCPFHGEKTPSFVVSPERQIWHCFGCNKGGDCFSFLMQYENLEFPEALRILAKKAGIELERTHFEIGVSSKKEKIYLLNRKAMDFYHYLLVSHNVGKKALEYLLKTRKIRMETINTFKLGFAPRIGDSLVNYLINKKNYKKEELVDAGLAFYRNGKALDFFTNRIMFPLFDHRDNIIGFSGRVLDASAGSVQVSKYVNTRETLVYHKGSVFFGLNIAKEKIKKENFAIVVEGEFDVISSFEEGLTNTVAVKGTALTENQVSLLSRFTQKVSLCFDQDLAGQEAIRRSLTALEKKELTTTVIVIPDAKDPDEAIKKDPGAFKKAVKNDVNVYDFLINKAISHFAKDTVDGKRKISSDILPLLTNIQNEIIKEHYFRKLAKELDTSFESIAKQAEKISKKETEVPLPKTQKEKRVREEVLEEYLLALIVQAKNLSLLEIIKETLGNFSFKNVAYQKILDQLFIYLEKIGNQLEHGKFLTMLPQELIAGFDVCYLLPLSQFENEDKYKLEVAKTARELKTLYLKMKIKETSEKIKEKEKNGKDEKELELLEKELNEAIFLYGSSF